MEGQARRRAADGRAVRRAAGRRARSTSAAPGPAPAAIRLRDARVEALLGAPDRRATRRPRSSSALGLRRRDARTTGSTSPCPHLRRNDVTREADLIEEVARIWGLEKLPVDAAVAPRRAPGGSTAAQRLRRRAGDALVGRRALRGRRLELRRARARRAAAAAGRPARRRRCATRCPRTSRVLRTTLLGSLLDVARRNRARGASDVRLFEAGRGLPAPTARATRPRRARAAAGRAHAPRRAADRRACGPPTWREPRAAARRLLRRQGRAAALLGALRVPWTRRAARREPFLHPGRAARVLVGGEPAGWLGELHPRRRRASWDLERRRRGFELDLDACSPRAVVGAALRGPDQRSRRCARTSRWSCPTASRPPSVRRRRARRRRRAARAAPRCSTSTAASRSARATCRWRCGSSSARPTAR